MSKAEPGLQTTIRKTLGEDGQLRFARRLSMTDKVLGAALPILWSLVVVVLVAVVWWLVGR